MKKLYTIRDVLTGFGVQNGVPAIIDLHNDQEAIRVVKGSCVASAQPNALNTNAEDKELWCIGEFDERTGKITACEPYLVAKAIEYLEAKKDVNLVSKSSKDA